MKRLLVILGLLFSVCVSAQIDKVVPSRPSSFYAIVDQTNTLTSQQLEALNQKLIAYKDSTTTEIAVVIVSTTGDYSATEVALEIIRKWGVGTKERNNGIVLLIAKDDRKLRIETGYGMEGAIPDITAKHIIEERITPSFKDGNYYRGIDLGIDAIIKAAAGEYKAPANYGSKKKKAIGWGSIAFVIIIIIIGIMGGGSGGGGGGGALSGAGWVIGSLLSSGRSGGGGWSSGGGGGGFGGFGGGSGGGGGASGSW
ncbi:MAG: TPM domain-containing protein [Chitinophagaceae bacterium]|nr:TPM domain-containing protein [Chitinophagaceae bacterium]